VSTTTPNTTTVSADALRTVLSALCGPGHLIRELQATRGIDALTGSENPINQLVREANEQAAQARPATPKAPKSDMPGRLRALSESMIDLATDMDYYGGFGPMASHGTELAGAAGIVLTWAEGIERDCASTTPEAQKVSDITELWADQPLDEDKFASDTLKALEGEFIGDASMGCGEGPAGEGDDDEA
jgi:hypothetical protein